MNQNIKRILLLASITVLLISACDAQSLDAAAAPGVEQRLGAQIEPSPKATPQGDIGDAAQVITLESIQVQAPISPTGPIEAISDVNPGDIPQLAEMDAILDQVNRGGPERPGSDEVVVAGPEPETESILEPVNSEGIPGGTLNREDPDGAESAVNIQVQALISPTGPIDAISDADPEDIPSAEELDAILDQVNRGGPERPGSDETAIEGPAPGMESVPGPGEARKDILDWVNLIVETLRNWWYELLN